MDRTTEEDDGRVGEAMGEKGGERGGGAAVRAGCTAAERLASGVSAWAKGLAGEA